MVTELPARYRITFAKTEAMRFIGHLDLHRSWERTFRRAGLPLAYSQGFHPHPRLHLAAALPLGVLGEAELLDAWLAHELEPAELLDRLRRAAPPGLHVRHAEKVDSHEPKLQPRVEAATFLASWPDTTVPAGLDERVRHLLAQSHLERERRGKTYDLRPLIRELELLEAADGGSCLKMQLSAGEGATGRPEEVLMALGLDPSAARTTRLCLSLAPLTQPQPR